MSRPPEPPPGDGRLERARRIGLGAGALALALLLAAAWAWSPLRDLLDRERLLAALETVKESPITPLIVLGGYLAGGLVIAPVSLLLTATVVSFGPWPGIPYALAGSVLSAALSYGIGRALGRDLVHRFAGARVNRISRAMARRGVLAMAAVRFLPLAPFSVVNLAAGASHLRFRDFIVGTALGMSPGILGIAFLVDLFESAVRRPDAARLAGLAAGAAAVAVAALALRRWIRRRGEPSS